MALIDKLKDTVTGAVKVARTAGSQVQSTAAPAVRQTARLVRSQLDQRLGRPPGPRPSASTPQPAPAVADAPAPPVVKAEPPAAPTPAKVAKNIAPHRAAPAPKKRPAKKTAPGAKLPVKRAAAKPDPA
jgi:hypothetical protein